jgi:ABC-2 type transport system ATP-binding protein/lipopolysaccharide transport system ATP-binding protein
MASVSLTGVSVSFPIYDASNTSLKKRLLPTLTGGRIGAADAHVPVVEALEGITITMEHGDRVGLVGHNGAGKTTLLRVLAGIYEPASGQVQITGRAVPLFDIGLGMDAEATGYENIYLRGLFLGISRKEIKRRIDDIASFTELGDFLHLPIRTYSTGMRMRLAFAISTSVEPDILLLDEGIGAGDAAFVEKANQRIQSFASRAGIIVLASHSEDLIRRICRTAILMERGRILDVGEVEPILERYRERLAQ